MIFNNRIIAGGGAIAGFHPNWGIVVSDDTGYTWRVSNNGLPPEFTDVNVIQKSGSETFIGTGSAGVFYSSNYGDNWSPRNNGLNGAYTEDVIFSDDGSIYTASYGCGIARSTDKGETWEILNNGLSSSFTSSIIETDEGVLLTGTDYGTFRSTDKGKNWVQTGVSGNFYAYNMFKDKQNRIYAATWSSGLWRSTNTGLNWTKLDQGFTSGHVIAMAIDSSGTIYAGAGGGAIYKSTNDGISWTEVYRSSITAFMYSISIAPNGYIFVCSQREGLLRSTDSGNSWELLTGIASKELWSVMVTEKGEVFVGADRKLPLITERKVYLSTDYGESWSDITGPLETILVFEFKIDKEGYIYLGTDESLWRSTAVTTEVPPSWTEISDYTLQQNYPNPFNPTTKIRYTLKAEGNIKLLIYDIKGELVSTLVNEKQQAGSYEVDFALPENISTGVYIYRLTVSDNNTHNVIFSDVKKMVYLK
jgi:photosystem II stability/assembly factor-like uncharacterized protein